MKAAARKILPLLFVTVLLSSTLLVMHVHAPTSVTTTSSLYIAPNPVGVGQQVSAVAWIQPDPPAGEFFTDSFEIILTLPDGTSNDYLGPADVKTDGNGAFYFDYTPYVLGTHTFALHFLGETLSAGIDSVTYDYLPSNSAPVSLKVQDTAVPPGVPVVPGDDVTIHPDPEELRISLHFDQIMSPGTATVLKTATPPSGVQPLTGILGPYYDFEVTFAFTDPVEVGLPYDEGLTNEELLSMWHYEGGVVGDVNGDNKVDWRDLLRITLALGSTPGMRRWDSACDLNSDNRVNLADLRVALGNYGQNTRTWVDVTTYVDTNLNIVYGSTTNFPPFGIRYT